MGMENTRWWQYLEGLMGTQTAKEAAEKTGISASNFTRWKKGARADPDFVVKIARAYETNVLQALVEAEFITEEEANLTRLAPTLDLTEVGGAKLADEMERRTDLLRELISLTDRKDELAARRAKKEAEHEPTPEPTPEPERYVAKTKQVEPSEGDDDFGA